MVINNETGKDSDVKLIFLPPCKNSTTNIYLGLKHAIKIFC